METNKTEKNRRKKKTEKKNPEWNIQKRCDNNKMSNTCSWNIRRRKKGTQEIFQKVIIEYFLKIMSDMKPQLQEH